MHKNTANYLYIYINLSVYEGVKQEAYMKNEIYLGKPFSNYTAYYDAIWMLLDMNSEVGKVDMCENFINILYNFEDRTGAHFKEFSDCDVFNSIELKRIPKSTIEDPVAFFKKSIGEGFIVMQCLDIFYIDKYKEYLDTHTVHDPFIYGYDFLTDEFLCADYFDFTFVLKGAFYKPS